MADAKQFMVKLSGRDYMQVPGRVIMFREAHPQGAITTEIIAIGDQMLAKASVRTGEGLLLATGHASVRSGQGQKWSGREIEKAETAAIGRALGLAGYGTADADDDDGYLADAPHERPAAPQANGNGKPADPDAWTEEEASAWWAKASKVKGMTKKIALAILHVESLLDWKDGKAAADAKLETYKRDREAEELVF